MVADRRQPPVVLVVGDDHGTVEVLRRVLSRHGLRACTAAGAAEGLAVAAAQLPRMVVVDLPRAGLGSALQLLDWLRSHDDQRVATARVVVVEGPTSRELLHAAGADAHLERPIHATELLAAVDEQLPTPA